MTKNRVNVCNQWRGNILTISIILQNFIAMKNIIYFLLLSFLLGCYHGDQSAPNSMTKSSGFAEETEAEYDQYDDQSEPSAPPSQPIDPQQQNITEKENQTSDPKPRGKKIIRDGDMHTEVDNLKKAKSFIDSALKKYDAYYENEIYESYDYQSSYRLKIRVPAIHFDSLVNTASTKAGKVTLKNINARDVTEEFYDIKTRLENNESYLLQYRNLLKRANSIKDILEVQEKIRRLEEEMDSRKGRLKYLSDQVNYSTLNLTLIEKHEWQEKNKKSFFEKAWHALKEGGSIFKEFILVVLRLWPFAILIVGVVYFIKWLRRKRRNRKS